jgi:microcystin-dependent protein
MKKNHKKLLKIILCIVLVWIILLIIYFVYKKCKKESYNSVSGPNNILLTDNEGNLSQINFPKGMIVIWSGTETNIPVGWAICNGNNGTPDLRGRFVLGTDPNINDNTAPGYFGSTGGSETSSVTFTVDTIPAHTHGKLYELEDNSSCECGGGGCLCGFGMDHVTDDGKSRGLDTKPVVISTIPPYYSICYIIKNTSQVTITNLSGPNFDNVVLRNDSGNMSSIQFPKGIICNYNGDATAIPDGWVICNGENDTPDLRARFTVGINMGTSKDVNYSTYETKQKGGSKAISVTLAKNQLPPHTHGRTTSADNQSCDCGGGHCYCGGTGHGAYYTGTTNPAGGGQPVSFPILPPYYTLSFIMKV